MSSPGDRDPVADAATMGRSAQAVASALVAARFLPIWIAMAALLVVAALFAPSTLENTSWSYILPYGTILAIAALGQMLVVMQAGIDLSTAGVISLCGNVLVGVSVGSNHGLTVGILVCLGLGALVGLVNGILVGIVRLNPLIVTLAVGLDRARVQLEVRARAHGLVAGAGVALVVGGGEASRDQRRVLDGCRDRGRRRARPSLHGPRPAFSGGGCEPESGVDGRTARPVARRVRYTAAGALYAVAAILLAGVRISIDPAFGASYLLAPIAAVVLAGAALSGGLASATSTWVAAIALTFLTEMLLIFGLSAALQFVVFGAAIIVGMLVSGDRIASLLGRLLRRIEPPRHSRRRK